MKSKCSVFVYLFFHTWGYAKVCAKMAAVQTDVRDGHDGAVLALRSFRVRNEAWQHVIRGTYCDSDQEIYNIYDTPCIFGGRIMVSEQPRRSDN